MCWSEGASLAMIVVGGAATVVTIRRGETPAIPATIRFFTVMEALQFSGYQVLDTCGTPANQTVTLLSYFHIALQPLFINAFAMAIAPRPINDTTRRRVFALAGLASLLLLLRLVPLEWAGPCVPGEPLCGAAFCTVSGNWHIAWEVPLNNMWIVLGDGFRSILPFPDYILAVFALPLLYGAWRFVLFHAALGPLLAMTLTDNPNEMPAIWCLFSIGIVLLSLSPAIRGRFMASYAV